PWCSGSSSGRRSPSSSRAPEARASRRAHWAAGSWPAGLAPSGRELGEPDPSPAALAGRAPRLIPLGAGLAVVMAGLLFAAASIPHGADLAAALVGLAVLASLAYLAWQVDPAWLFTAALIGSTF